MVECMPFLEYDISALQWLFKPTRRSRVATARQLNLLLHINSSLSMLLTLNSSEIFSLTLISGVTSKSARLVL